MTVRSFELKRYSRNSKAATATKIEETDAESQDYSLKNWNNLEHDVVVERQLQIHGPKPEGRPQVLPSNTPRFLPHRSPKQQPPLLPQHFQSLPFWLLLLLLSGFGLEWVVFIEGVRRFGFLREQGVGNMWIWRRGKGVLGSFSFEEVCWRPTAPRFWMESRCSWNVGEWSYELVLPECV